MNYRKLCFGIEDKICQAKLACWLALLFLAIFEGDIRGQQQPQQQQQSQQQTLPSQQQAQTPAQEPKIAVDVKTVSVLATVRDKHGKIVSSLTKDDFVLEEDGRAQTINYFARENDLALKLGLLVDTSLSQMRVLEQERGASYSFLDHLLREKDLAFIIHFDHEVELLQEFTASRPKLQGALQSLQTPQFDGRNAGAGSGGRGQHRGGGTLLYDAIYLAADEVMSKQQGRKAVIILSDGVDHGSRESLTTAIETAQRADTVVYSILFADEEEGGNFGGFGRWPGGPGGRGPGGGPGGRSPREQHPDGKKILEQISRETGGRFFKGSKKDLEKIYAQIDEDLRNEYSLGYTPDKSAGAGYHKIHLTTHDKNQVVQARDGYYSGQ